MLQSRDALDGRELLVKGVQPPFRLGVCNADAGVRHGVRRPDVRKRAAAMSERTWNPEANRSADNYFKRLEQTLASMLDDQLQPLSRVSTSPPPRVAAEANVRFVEDKDGQLSWLEVETDDRAGLLLTLSRVLFEQRVQIVSSHVRTEAGRVKDKFAITELNDDPISNERRMQVQVAVLSAIQRIMGG